MKIINVKGIIILVVVLVVVQVAFGMIISPVAGSIIIKEINKHSSTKIDIGRISVWPLTLSCSFRNLDIYNPGNQKEKMVSIKKASARISVWGLLCKRLVIAGINVSGAQINFEEEADGSFNVQKLAEGTEAQTGKSSIFDRFKKKKDWFSKIYEIVKNRNSKEAVDEKAKKEKEAGKITTKVEQLPKGRRVKFETARGGYLLEVSALKINDANVRLVDSGGDSIDIKGADIDMRRIAFDPEKGTRFDKLLLKGRLEKEKTPAGSFGIIYAQTFKRKTQKTIVKADLNKIDLPSVRFIYDDSLPVSVQKGELSLNSNSEIINGQLNSDNSLVLENQNLSPKGGVNLSLTGATMPVICEALNATDPVKLKFKITGTVENPQFTGFEDSLMKLIKPKLGNITKNLKEKGVSALSNMFGGKSSGTDTSGSSETQGTQSAVKSITSLFGKSDK